MQPRSQPHSLLIVGLLFAASAGVAVVWLALNHAPPTWDDAIYLSASLRLYDALTERGIAGFVRQFESIFTIRAPLISALPASFYLVFGRGWHAAFLVNIAAMFVLFATVFSLARRWWSSRAGVLSVAIVATMPLMYGLSRWFMVEYALAAIVAVSIWLLVHSDELKRGSMILLFGVSCGLGLLMKVNFAAFIAPAALYAWSKSRNRVHVAILAVVPCALIALPWYAVHLVTVIGNAVDAGYGRSAVLQGTGPIFALHSIGLYLWHVLREGISFYYGGLALVLLAWSILTKKRWFGTERLTILLWLSPFFLFLFGGNKDVRYIAPLLPAVALILGAGLDRLLPRSRAGNATGFLMCSVAAVHMLSVSFLFPFHTEELGYALHYDHASWPLHEILADIAAQAAAKPGERPTIVVGSDRIYFNPDNLNLIVEARHLPFEIQAVAHQYRLDTIAERLSHASFFVYKDGGEPEESLINPHFGDAVRLVHGDRSFVELGTGRRLPDGGIARIFQRIPPRRLANKSFATTSLDVPEDFAVNYGGVVDLTGLLIARKGPDLEVRYRWRSRSTARVDYWCFTHILDSQGKIIEQLDHPLMDGSPSVRLWQPGAVAVEQIDQRVPQASEGARLEIGIYDPVSGSRLAIQPLRDQATARFTVRDDSTALVTRDPEVAQPRPKGHHLAE